MEQQSFGYWLKHKRKALDLTREGLAERVGYSAATIRKIEDEERRPSAQIIERLADVFNIPPDERTAFSGFARGDWKSAPRESGEDVPWRPSNRPARSNLPATVTSLIGRDNELADVRAYVLDSNIRLVTLIGPPGIGKTRLSIEAARAALPDFVDGVFFIALAPLSDPTLIASTIAHTLGYVESKNLSPNEQIIDGIGEKQMLLVLDNCEHLIEEVASLASALLSACSRLKLLTTSRESLRISGEWLYPVPAFELPDRSSVDVETAGKNSALRLFAERARTVRFDFALNANNIQTIVAICAYLDGLPLAIELIAARMRLMSPESLLARLNDQFILYANGMRAASARQKTLNDAIDWSYGLLAPEEQKLFAYLSVFSGGFTLDAVESMFSRKVTEKPLSTLIALLVDKSLLKFAPDLEAQGQAFYTMLVTIQEYARERLRGMGEETEIRNWHLAYFLEFAEQGGKEMRGPKQVEWLNRLIGMRDNLRAALDWAIETEQTEAALLLTRNLHWFWFVHSDHNEARLFFARVLAMPNTFRHPQLKAQALAQLAHHIWTQIGPTEARAFAEEALALARAWDDKQNTARALCILGLIWIKERNFVAAQSSLEESSVLFLEMHEAWEYAHTVIALALAAYRQDDLATSLALHEQALTLFQKIGDRYFQSVAHYFIGILQTRQGDVHRGVMTLRESVILAQQLDSKYGIAEGVLRMGQAALYAKRLSRAVRLYYAARDIYDSVGAWQQEDELKLENDLAPCHTALSEAEFAEAEQHGRLMTMEQTIDYALENDD